MSEQSETGQPRPAPLTLAESQRAVDASILALGGYWPPLANLARLFEECGELARVVNQTHGPKRVKPDEARGALTDELGDVLYSVFVLANTLGVDAEDALRGALDKISRRTGASTVAPDASLGGQRETDL